MLSFQEYIIEITASGGFDFKLTKGLPVEYEFVNPKDSETYRATFFDDPRPAEKTVIVTYGIVEEDDIINYDITNVGNPLQILGTVLNIIRDFTKNHKDVNRISFAAENKDRSRASVYKRLAAKLFPDWKLSSYLTVNKTEFLMVKK